MDLFTFFHLIAAIFLTCEVDSDSLIDHKLSTRLNSISIFSIDSISCCDKSVYCIDTRLSTTSTLSMNEMYSWRVKTETYNLMMYRTGFDIKMLYRQFRVVYTSLGTAVKLNRICIYVYVGYVGCFNKDQSINQSSHNNFQPRVYTLPGIRLYLTHKTWRARLPI